MAIGIDKMVASHQFGQDVPEGVLFTFQDAKSGAMFCGLATVDAGDLALSEDQAEALANAKVSGIRDSFEAWLAVKSSATKPWWQFWR